MEPAAGRYQVDYDGYAQMFIDGALFGGPSGAPLQPSNRVRRVPPRERDPLGVLRLLLEVTQARYSGAEAVRGTPCRAVAVLVFAEVGAETDGDGSTTSMSSASSPCGATPSRSG